MSKTKSKVVDLEMSSDGSYSPKRVKERFVPSGKSRGREVMKHSIKGDKKKYLLINEVDEFLSGVDAGLDLLDTVLPRVDRFLRLRG